MIIEENNNNQQVTEIQATRESQQHDEIEEEFGEHDFRNPRVMSEVMKTYYGKFMTFP